MTSARISPSIFETQNTALHLAAMHGYEKIVSYLLSIRGQQILKNDKKQDVLDVAVIVKKTDVAMEIANNERYEAFP